MGTGLYLNPYVNLQSFSYKRRAYTFIMFTSASTYVEDAVINFADKINFGNWCRFYETVSAVMYGKNLIWSNLSYFDLITSLTYL
jgi:hypothetical protein